MGRTLPAPRGVRGESRPGACGRVRVREMQAKKAIVAGGVAGGLVVALHRRGVHSMEGKCQCVAWGCYWGGCGVLPLLCHVGARRVRISADVCVEWPERGGSTVCREVWERRGWGSGVGGRRCCCRRRRRFARAPGCVRTG